MNKKIVLFLESFQLLEDNIIERLLIILISELLKDKPELTYYLWCEGIIIDSEDFEVINSHDETGDTVEIVPVVNYDYKKIYNQLLTFNY